MFAAIPVITSADDICHPPSVLDKDFVPSKYDILCGKGRSCSGIVGNQQFLEHVKNNIHRYMNCNSKMEKTMVVNQIVDDARRIHPTRRTLFVRRDSSTGRWCEIGDKGARDKAGHLMRSLVLKTKRARAKQANPSSASPSTAGALRPHRIHQPIQQRPWSTTSIFGNNQQADKALDTSTITTTATKSVDIDKGSDDPSVQPTPDSATIAATRIETEQMGSIYHSLPSDPAAISIVSLDGDDNNDDSRDWSDFDLDMEDLVEAHEQELSLAAEEMFCGVDPLHVDMCGEPGASHVVTVIVSEMEELFGDNDLNETSYSEEKDFAQQQHEGHAGLISTIATQSTTRPLSSRWQSPSQRRCSFGEHALLLQRDLNILESRDILGDSLLSLLVSDAP